MPPTYNWRRSRQTSSASSSDSPTASGGRAIGDSPPIKPLRTSINRGSLSSNERRTPSPSSPPPIQMQNPAVVDYSHLHLAPLSNPKPASNNEDCCPTCHVGFDEAIEVRQPRIMPCLHTFCTSCIRRVQEHLEALSSRWNSGTRTSRYSWRNRTSGSSPVRGSSPTPPTSTTTTTTASAKTVLGNFLCPLCHELTPISGGHEAVRSFPLNKLLCSGLTANADSHTNSPHLPLLEMVVREIHPKIKVIQAAVLETEVAKCKIDENVASIEARLIPERPSASETIGKVRSEALSKLHLLRLKKMNSIVRRQLMLKQSEKDLRFLCNILQKLKENVAVAKSMGPTILPWIAKKLSSLSNILEDATKSESGSAASKADDNFYSVETFARELFSAEVSPDKAFAELSNPLYEKVVCDIPLLMVDSKKDIVPEPNLSKLSGGLLLKKDDFVKARIKSADYSGSISMEVVPPTSGLAEIDLKYEDKTIPVRPSTAFIRPLSLDPVFKRRSSSNTSLHSGHNVQFVAL